MNAEEKRNVIQGSEIDAGKDVNIGDRTTVNVYGMEASKGDLEFFIKFFMGLIAVFAIAFLVFLIWFPDPKSTIFDYIKAFVCGGVFALVTLLLVFLLRSKYQSSITIK